MMGAPKQDAYARFYRKIEMDRPDDCWIWNGALSRGYGRFWYEGRTITAHRWYYEQVNGVVPEPLELDHTCRRRNCVNPSHLEVVTHVENLHRSPKGGRGIHQTLKTHCPRGHAYIGRNIMRNSKGGRYCRTCQNARQLRTGLPEWYTQET